MTLNSRISQAIDAVTFLQTEASAAVTATGPSESVLSLDSLAAFWFSGGPAHQQLNIAVNVTDLFLSVLTAATGLLTLTGNAADTNTVVIDGKTYTFQTSLTNVDGNVFIGATASDSIDNLISAITLGPGSGTTYAALTTLHTTVTASVGAGDTMVATAKVKGTGGDAITTTETLVAGTWTSGATFSGGADTDETYVFALQVDSEAAFGDSPVILSQAALDKAGYFVFSITQEQINELDFGATHLRILTTLAGTAPSVTYSARATGARGGSIRGVAFDGMTTQKIIDSVSVAGFVIDIQDPSTVFSDNGETLANIGDDVVQVNDISGNGHHLTHVNGAAGTYEQDPVTGRYYIDKAGGSSWYGMVGQGGQAVLSFMMSAKHDNSGYSSPIDNLIFGPPRGFVLERSVVTNDRWAFDIADGSVSLTDVAVGSVWVQGKDEVMLIKIMDGYQWFSTDGGVQSIAAADYQVSSNPQLNLMAGAAGRIYRICGDLVIIDDATRALWESWGRQ